MPFGEDLYNGVGSRDSALKYNSADDDVRQKFTGYQKDEETQLDFAEARMYENRHARFTTVDPLLASGNSANPQTFNRFVYVGNNPINITDPLGLDWFHNTKNNIYEWFDNNPGEGYTAVDFGESRVFNYQGCISASCAVTATSYLHKEGGWNWDYNSYSNAVGVYNDLFGSNITYLPNDVRNGLFKGARNFGRGILNSPIETPLIPFTPTSLNDVGVTRFLEYETYDNEVEQAAGIYANAMLTGATILATRGAASRGNSFASSSVTKYANKSKCFVAGTLIHTENGLLPIEKIEAGDKVLSYNEDGRQVEYQEVVRLFRNTSDIFLKIKVSGEQELIEVTLGHPFYVHRNRSNLSADADDEGDWVLSKSLRVGDLLRDKTGEWQPIISIEVVEQTQATYNFEVKQNHNYYVGENGWLVHNDSGEGWISKDIYSELGMKNPELRKVFEDSLGKGRAS